MALLLLMTSWVVSTQPAAATTAAATSTDSLWVGNDEFVGVCESPTSTAALADCFTTWSSQWYPEPTLSTTATDGVNVYFAGTGGGLSCPVSGAGTDCTRIAAGPWNGTGVVTALAASDGELWIGQSDGQIYRCPADLPYGSGTLPSQCVLLDDAGNRGINALILANGTLYAGLSPTKNQGLLWTCDAQTENSCSTLDSTGQNSIKTLAAGGGYLWAGLSNGILWRCDPTATNACDNWDQAGGAMNSISYDGQGTIYAAIAETGYKANGVIWSCPTSAKNSCDNVVSNLTNATAVAAGPDNVFWSNDSPPLNYGTSPYAGAVKAWGYAGALLYLPAEGPTGVGTVSVRIRPPASGIQRLRAACTDDRRTPRVRLRITGPHHAVVTRRAGLCRLSKGKAVRTSIGLLDPGTHQVKARFSGTTKRHIMRSRTVLVKPDRTVRVPLRCPGHG